MSLTSERMMKLMAYADGELEDAERREVEGWLATDGDAARFANELAGLGDLVQVGHRESPAAKAIASFDIADAVMVAVKADEEKKPAVAPVVSLDARRQRTRTTIAAAAAAFALAASVFFVMRPKGDVPLAQVPVAPSAPSAVASADPGVDVALEESGEESVQVFYLSNESSPTTSVIVWVDEPGAK